MRWVAVIAGYVSVRYDTIASNMIQERQTDTREQPRVDDASNMGDYMLHECFTPHLQLQACPDFVSRLSLQGLERSTVHHRVEGLAGIFCCYC